MTSSDSESSASSSDSSELMESNGFILDSKLQKCEVCAQVEAKYTCPKCEVKTCSLPCVKIHKKELDCDGVRNRVAFKPISKMTNLDLLSDYRLLEEAGRSVHACKKDLGRPGVRELPVHLTKLRRATGLRGTRLELLPQHFARRKSNTTYLNWKTNILSWRVEWIFPEADNSKFVDERVVEDIPLMEQLEARHLNPLSVNKILQIHKAAGVEGLVLLLEAENVKKHGEKRFFQLDPLQSLKVNLQGKTIVEFPRIYVVLKSNIANYDIIGLEEVKTIASEIGPPGKVENMRHQNKKRRFDNQKTNGVKQESKNLLFCQSDSSESDDPEERRNLKIQRVKIQ